MRYRELRWPCDHPVTLLRGDRGLDGRIVNISNSGARVVLDEPLGQGERVMLNVTGQPLPGEVRWVRGKLAGLRFDRLLTPRETAIVRKTDCARQQRKGWNLQLRELS
jgi:hypothetical protein